MFGVAMIFPCSVAVGEQWREEKGTRDGRSESKKPTQMVFEREAGQFKRMTKLKNFC